VPEDAAIPTVAVLPYDRAHVVGRDCGGDPVDDARVQVGADRDHLGLGDLDPEDEPEPLTVLSRTA